MSAECIVLVPRPYTVSSGRLLLLPLLPKKPAVKPLPVEIWSRIFSFTLDCDEDTLLSCPPNSYSAGCRLSLLSVCRSFKAAALPVFYSRVQVQTVSNLEKLTRLVHAAEQKWDSLRRTPYSSPGRWIQVLDLSQIPWPLQSDKLPYDSLLTQLFPLLPFLARLSLNPEIILSRRALRALGSRDGSANLRILEGIGYSNAVMNMTNEDAFVELLRCCPTLEELEVVGPGADLLEFEFPARTTVILPTTCEPLDLPRLHNLTVLSMNTSSLLLTLMQSQLPSLRRLTITPYEDIPYPYSIVSRFIERHGEKLHSLLLTTPKELPTRLHHSPGTILTTCPNLIHLSLETPLPVLSQPTASEAHTLRILSIPRPKAEFWKVLESLLPYLPSLVAVRARDVRWLRKDLSSYARGTGVQGEMGEWKKRLARRGIKVLDADWKEC